MYIYHSISIDYNQVAHAIPYTAKAYSYEPGSHHLLHQLLSNHRSRSHYFYHICSVSSFFKYQKPVYHRRSTKTSLQPSRCRRSTKTSLQLSRYRRSTTTSHSHYAADDKHHQTPVERTIKPSVQARSTNGRSARPTTDDRPIKSKSRNVKIRFLPRHQLDPARPHKS